MKIKQLISILIGISTIGTAIADVSLGNGPDKSLIAFTKCSDITPTNIITGYLGDYTFKQGFSEEERSGLINREKGKLSYTCILPSLQPNQIVYMEVDTKQFKEAGSSNDWVMQCVRSEKPGDGIVGEKESRTESPYSVNYLSGKAMMLHCGHSEKNAEVCGEGSNSSRSGQWDKKLDASGKTMLSILANSSPLAPAGGEKLYCQYYNKKSGKSLFAFEYLRTKK